MRVLFVLITLLFSLSAQAQTLRRGIACNTVEEMRSVIKENTTPKGCTQDIIVFIEIEKVEEVWAHERHFTIFQVVVIGAVINGDLKQTKPLPQYIHFVSKKPVT